MVRRLLYLNGLAAIGVVLNHALGWGFVAKFWWVHRYLPVSSPSFASLGDFTYYVMRAVEQIIIVSIPIFLFVSGFFISVASGRKQSTVGWGVVLSRIKNLLIPYLIWSGVVFLLQFMESRTLLPLGEYLSRLVFGRTYDIFYFIPVLVQLYLLSPFLVPLAKNKPKLLLIGAGLIQLVVLFLRYGVILELNSSVMEPLGLLMQSWFFPGFIFWFSLGIVVGFRLQDLKAFLLSVNRHVLLVLLFGLFCLGMWEWEFLLQQSGLDWIAPRDTLIDALYSAVFILTYLAFDQVKYPIQNQIASLGTNSYGIYLVHAPVLEYSARVIYHLLPLMLASQLIFLPILITLGLGIPLLLMTVVKKSPARLLYGYLFG